jgi:hypothetical protein
MPYLLFLTTCCPPLGNRRGPIKQNHDCGGQTRQRRLCLSVIGPKLLRSNRFKTVGKEELGSKSNKDFTNLSVRRTYQKGAVSVRDCARPEGERTRLCGTFRL